MKKLKSYLVGAISVILIISMLLPVGAATSVENKKIIGLDDKNLSWNMTADDILKKYKEAPITDSKEMYPEKNANDLRILAFEKEKVMNADAMAMYYFKNNTLYKIEYYFYTSSPSLSSGLEAYQRFFFLKGYLTDYYGKCKKDTDIFNDKKYNAKSSSNDKINGFFNGGIEHQAIWEIEANEIILHASIKDGSVAVVFSIENLNFGKEIPKETVPEKTTEPVITPTAPQPSITISDIDTKRIELLSILARYIGANQATFLLEQNVNDVALSLIRRGLTFELDYIKDGVALKEAKAYACIKDTIALCSDFEKTVSREKYPDDYKMLLEIKKSLDTLLTVTKDFFTGIGTYCSKSSSDKLGALNGLEYAIKAGEKASTEIVNIYKISAENTISTLQKINTIESGVSSTTQLPTSPTAPSNNTTTNSGKKYTEGMYKVGTDIAAGEYILICDKTSAYFAVSSDSSGKTSSIKANENFKTRSIITVKSGEYLEIKSCTAYPSSDISAVTPTNGVLEEGMYKVGKDIPAGEYKVTPYQGKTGYYAVCKDSSHLSSAIVANDNFDGSKYITVENGQYILLSNCSIKIK